MMRYVFAVLSIILIFTVSSAQGTTDSSGIHDGSFEFAVGYSNFDKVFNGGHITAGYNYSWSKNFLAHGAIAFDLGKTSRNGESDEDTFIAGSAHIGLKGQLPIFGSHKIRGGPEFGVMLLNLDRSEITEDPLLFPIIYGFSVSYSIAVSSKVEIGLSFSQHYMTNFDFSNQRIGVLLIYKK